MQLKYAVCSPREAKGELYCGVHVLACNAVSRVGSVNSTHSAQFTSNVGGRIA